jgi:hypothetical protein
MPRARSAQDVPTGPRPNLVSGEPMVPVVAMGSAAVSNTFEGEDYTQCCDHCSIKWTQVLKCSV